MVTYTFDGSLKGILTAIFEAFERRHKEVKLVSEDSALPEIFNEPIKITTQPGKAERVWQGLQKKIDREAQRQYYSAFLSEQPLIMQHLFNYALYIFDSPESAFRNYGHPDVLAISQMAQKVHREKHRMEAFIRFQKSGRGLYFALIHPDFNVLPLIIRHFKNRYADQPWVIYDEKRKYGVHYDGNTVQEVTLELHAENRAPVSSADLLLDEEEALYGLLWKDYFKSTNIPARKNMKLHLQHVPKRYWRYLTEKQ